MNTDTEPTYRFLLFVSAGQKNSVIAEKNVTRFLDSHVKERYELRTVDVIHDPKFALEKGVYFTPMLIVTSPLPETYLAGDMSDEEKLKATILR